MTTLRFPTIWDLPLADLRKASESETPNQAFIERFLTIWDSPQPRRDEPASKRTSRKLPKFYL
jgi:hypothetical protein